MEARPTNYRGTQMRSRLEATYAQVCDLLGIAWTYEPGALASEAGQWLPDFVHHQSPMSNWEPSVTAYRDEHGNWIEQEPGPGPGDIERMPIIEGLLDPAGTWYIDVKPPNADRRRLAADIRRWHSIATSCDPHAIVAIASPAIHDGGPGPHAMVFGLDHHGQAFGCLIAEHGWWWWESTEDQLLGLLDEYWPRPR